MKSGGALTGQLYAAKIVGMAWYIMGSVGLVAAAGLYVYGRWTYQVSDQSVLQVLCSSSESTLFVLPPLLLRQIETVIEASIETRPMPR